MSREAIDRAYMCVMTVENTGASAQDRVRASMTWIQEVATMIPAEVLKPMAITILKDVDEPLLDEDGKPMIATIMQLMLRKCRCMAEDEEIADELEAVIQQVVERRRKLGGGDV